jgi:formyltetrahydrofolate-dependent phosphoribosylglycinamide formyltransferase
VRALKGPSRPVNQEEDRAEVLCALKAVDTVCVFSEPRATRLIQIIRPQVYAKGGDYTLDSLNPEERSALEAAGAEIRILPLVPGRSTTATIRRMAEEPSPSKPLRLAILGSGEGSNFKAILQAIQAGSLNAEIVAVVSDRADCGVMLQAVEKNLPRFHIDPGPHPYRFPAHAQKEVCEHLQRCQPDLIVLAGFMRILKQPVLEAFPDQIINIHPSLLPAYKGSNAVAQALAAGETHTGTTVHIVTAGVDEGRILAQKKVPIYVGDTAEILHHRIKAAEHELLPQVISEWKKIS